ncbi:hemin uptake protein HemP [Paraburkholderia sp. J41]|uniref:hemin uptake protein HemP n=1 Tax=Paraburkholderia sp. J41 TaxID=2805433 RepID=UPI002AC355B7|nr:hemin uptake protein HemP [Paraburkholderia sp. J41]
MTDLNRTSTLSLRRSGAALTGARPKPAVQTQPRKASEPAGTRATPASGAGATSAANATSGRVLDSAALLQGQSHVSIMHNGETYQLRATRLGKLILTK